MKIQFYYKRSVFYQRRAKLETIFKFEEIYELNTDGVYSGDFHLKKILPKGCSHQESAST